MAKDTVVCRCEEVTTEEVLEAIREGTDSLTGLKRRTRAGMGLCQGRTCRRLLAGLISQETGKPVQEILPPTARPPVRPVKLDLLGGGE